MIFWRDSNVRFKDGDAVWTPHYVEEIKSIRVTPSPHTRPDNQQVIGEGKVIIIGLESDNQQVIGENVVTLDVDNVINT